MIYRASGFFWRAAIKFNVCFGNEKESIDLANERYRRRYIVNPTSLKLPLLVDGKPIPKFHLIFDNNLCEA